MQRGCTDGLHALLWLLLSAFSSNCGAYYVGRSGSDIGWSTESALRCRTDSTDAATMHGRHF